MVEPQLVRDFVSTGQVYFEYRDYAFLGDDSVTASEAAFCAEDQGFFWEMHDAIFYNQVDGPYDRGAFGRDRLERIAETVDGLDIDAWASCMDGDTYEDAVEQAKLEGDQNGVSGTPSFIVDGELVFGASYEELSQMIQDAVGN